MFTWMPLRRSSFASVAASASSAAFAMLYGADQPAMCIVAALEIITMSPRGCVRIDGSTSLLHAHAPNACVRSTRSTSAGSVSATLWPRDAMPALLTRMST